MIFRNLSPQHMFEYISENHGPKYRFAGVNQAEFKEWKAKVKPEVMKYLGDL